MIKWIKMTAFALFCLALCSCNPPGPAGDTTRCTPQAGDEASGDSLAFIIEIKNKQMCFDEVVHGPLCDDTWGGIIYVADDVEVAPWSEKPLFLQDCDLVIEPGTVVYVSAHDDKPYYKGCSCHEVSEP